MVGGVFSNSGQNCCAISRLFIHESAHDKFIMILKAMIAKINIGDPREEDTEFGHLIDEQAFDKVSKFVNRAKQDGLTVWSVRKPERLMYPPTLVLDVPDDHLIAQEEIFGPVLSILKPFKDLNQVIPRVNNSQYGLAGGIFSKSEHELQLFVDKVDVGMIWQNTWNICPPDVPFGGMKNSGMGRELGIQAVLAFSHQKSVVAGKL